MGEKVKYGGIWLCVSLLRILPLGMAVRCGSFLGWLLYQIDRKHRNIAIDQIRRAIGQEQQAVRKIARRTFLNLGRTLAEVVQMATLPAEQIERRVVVEGFEHAEAARQKGKGVIYLSAHFGNWEWMTAVLAIRGMPMVLVARALDDPRLNAWLNACRERYGNTVLEKRVAASQVVRLLREGKSIGILLDQNTRAEDAVFVNYFGRLAATHKGMATLALRTGASVVPLWMERNATHHRLVIEPGISFSRTGNLQEDIRAITALFTQRLETAVRLRPDHWLWLHRRWKTPPT